MPDQKGLLSQEERDRAVAWLTEKESSKTNCPMCGFTSWGVGPNIVLVPLFIPGGLMVGGGYPAVIIMCNRCAYIRMHAAIPMGLLPPPKEEAKASTEDKASEPQPAEAAHGR